MLGPDFEAKRQKIIALLSLSGKMKSVNPLRNTALKHSRAIASSLKDSEVWSDTITLSIQIFLRKSTVSDRERSDVSGSIRSIRMYSYAQSTMQERLVCCRDVPCLVHMEQGSGPLHLSTFPPPYLPEVMGTKSTSSLQQGWTWTGERTLATSPTQNLWSRIMYIDIVFISI